MHAGGHHGSAKQGMDISYKGIWGYHASSQFGQYREVLSIVNRPAIGLSTKASRRDRFAVWPSAFRADFYGTFAW